MSETAKWSMTGAPTALVLGKAHVGGKCEFCPEPLLPKWKWWQRRLPPPPALTLPTDQGDRFTHEACFWRARATQFEQLFNQAHQLTCAMVASRGGFLRVGPNEFRQAAEAGFDLQRENLPNGEHKFRLGKRLIELASRLPPRPA